MSQVSQFCLPAELPPSPTLTLCAPVSGQVHPLSCLPSALMAHGLLGAGVCIEMHSHKLVAPCDGQLLSVDMGAKQWRFKSNNGVHILVHLHSDEPTLTNKAKLSALNCTPVRKGMQLAYFDLRQFKLAPRVAMIVTHTRFSAEILFSHKQAHCAEPLLFIYHKK